MADQLIEVINACRARRTISVDDDIPFIDLIRIRALSFDDINAIRNFQDAIHKEFGIELLVVGGGYGCSKISITVTAQSPEHAVAILKHLMSIDAFREEAIKAGFCSALLGSNFVNLGTGEAIGGSISGTSIGLLLFLSYSPSDNKHRIELEKHLTLLKRKGMIYIWHNREIMAGSDYHKEVDLHVNKADIILLMVSVDFLHSDYCCGVEMKTALTRHRNSDARVIPIIVRSVDWVESEFSHLKVLPRDGKAITSCNNQDEAWTEVAKEIRDVVQDISRRRVSSSGHGLRIEKE